MISFFSCQVLVRIDFESNEVKKKVLKEARDIPSTPYDR